MQLNLVFHNIVLSTESIKNRYTLTLDYYLNLLNNLNDAVNSHNTSFSAYHLYFDDGYISFENLIFPKISDFSKYTLAIVTDDINKKGYLTNNMLRKYDKRGISISSHGTSHSSLGFYKNNVLQRTPDDGPYRNSPKGQNRPLSVNEIIYQFKESKTFLQELLKHKVDEFVLPYGIYNNSILEINETNGIYNFISTCDEYLDRGGNVRPRFLIDNSRSVDETILKILELK